MLYLLLAVRNSRRCGLLASGAPGGRELWVVSRSTLVAMKLAAGRPQDLGDVQKLSETD